MQKKQQQQQLCFTFQDQYVYIHECMKDALSRGISLKPAAYQEDDLPGMTETQRNFWNKPIIFELGEKFHPETKVFTV